MDIPYDPDFIYDPQSDSEDNMFDEQDNDIEYDIEFDNNYEPLSTIEIGAFEIGVAVGFGHNMAQEEIDEDKIAKQLLKKRKSNKEQTKVPLSTRHTEEIERGKPFERWYLNVLRGKKKVTDPLDYTEKELYQIALAELEDEVL
ncbi:MAG: hypothetical protein DRO67_01770 [Candidatus Asgardarchaeum californiense]|nr:MAG: hypothetical protein DRO67_01770 [Candidatus Asgardarchaeum californiense]